MRLAPLSMDHAEGMFRMWSRPEVCAYAGPAEDAEGLPLELPARSRATSDRLIAFWLDRAKRGTGFRWAVLLPEPIGFVGAVGFNTLGACAEYAYHFDPTHWGGGLATEASRLAIAWAISFGSEAVEAFIEEANVASIRLVERLGFAVVEPSSDGLARYVLARTDR